MNPDEETKLVIGGALLTLGTIGMMYYMRYSSVKRCEKAERDRLLRECLERKAKNITKLDSVCLKKGRQKYKHPNENEFYEEKPDAKKNKAKKPDSKKADKEEESDEKIVCDNVVKVCKK